MLKKEQKPGRYKFLSRFANPREIKRTALLTWEQKRREDDQWLYLPAYGRKLKRISRGNKKGYFMGTNFAYEDLRLERFEDHKYKILKKEKFKGDKQ